MVQTKLNERNKLGVFKIGDKVKMKGIRGMINDERIYTITKIYPDYGNSGMVQIGIPNEKFFGLVGIDAIEKGVEIKVE